MIFKKKKDNRSKEICNAPIMSRHSRGATYCTEEVGFNVTRI